MANRSVVPPHHETVYTIFTDGQVEVRIVGPRRFEVLYPMLALAAQYAFLYAHPIVVMENGLPFRVVDVYNPL